MKDNLVNESGGLVNDCISRQAAIDGKITAVISGQAIEAIPESYIKKLPSAQPQSTMGQPTDAVQSTKDCISRQAAIDDENSTYNI